MWNADRKFGILLGGWRAPSCPPIQHPRCIRSSPGFEQRTVPNPMRTFSGLEKGMVSIVRDERKKEGGSGHLPNARNQSTTCHCGKSKVSFSHWPPSTYEEAVEQVRCLIGESSPHRLYLAHCWIVSLRQKLATVREPFSQRYHERIIELVEANCEIEKYSGGEALGRQARNVDCKTISPKKYGYRQVVIRMGNSGWI